MMIENGNSENGKSLNKKRRLQLAAAVAAIALMGAGAAQAQETVKVGLIEPLTGSVAYNGQEVVDGAKLAMKTIAADGKGARIELDIQDGQCSPVDSVNAMQKLVEQDHVAVVIGAFCSSATAAIMPLAKKYKVPLVTGVSSAANLTEQGNEYFFRAAETDALLAKAFASALVDNLHLKSVAYVGVNDDWGRGSVQSFKTALSGLGVKPGLTEYFDHGTTNFFTLATKLRAAGPDGIFVAAETQDGSILLKQLQQFGIKAKIFGVGSWATADFIKLAGPAAEGVYAAVPYVSTETSARNVDFVKKYQDAYKAAPGKYGAAGYNAVNIVAEAIARAGSAEPEAIRTALKKTEYKAPNGVYRFTDKGQAYGFDAMLVQLHEGSAKVVADSPVKAQ